MPSTGTLIALAIVGVVVGAAIYLATRPTAALPSVANGGMLPTGSQAEGAQYISAAGGAVGSILTGVSSLYSNIGRQSSGASSGGTGK